MECALYTPSIQNKLDLFFEKAFQSCGFNYDPYNKHNDLKNIQTVFIDTGGGFWVLIENNKVIGSAGLKIIDNINKIGELKCMYVLTDYQGKGHGQLLLDKVILECKQRTIKTLRLDVKVKADKAISLYEKNGFHNIPRYNNNSNNVVFMEKSIL